MQAHVQCTTFRDKALAHKPLLEDVPFLVDVDGTSDEGPLQMSSTTVPYKQGTFTSLLL